MFILRYIFDDFPADRDAEIKCRSFSRFALYAILAIVPADDLCADIKPDTEPLKTVGGIFHPVELAEDIRLMVFADADAMISYFYKDLYAGLHPRLDEHLFIIRRIFDGIT